MGKLSKVAGLVLLFALVGCARKEPEPAYYFTTKKLTKQQEKLIHDTILAENKDDSVSDDLAYIEHHDVLQFDETDKKIVIYARVLCKAYNHNLEMVSGIQAPVRMILEKGNYELQEYWLPKDGSLYESSIIKAFPDHLVKKAMETDYYDGVKEDVDKKAAKDYFKQKDKGELTQ